MSVNLPELLKIAVTPEIISRLSDLTGENPEHTQSAVYTSFSLLLAGLIKKGSTESGAADIMKLIKDGGYDGNLLNNLGNVLKDNQTLNAVTTRSSNTLNSLTSGRLNEYSSFIVNNNHIGKNSVSYIWGFTTSVLMSMLGKQILSSNINMKRLTEFLTDQKKHLLDFIPAGLAELLGISPDPEDQNSYLFSETGPDAGRKKFMPWLLIAISAILLFGIWRITGDRPPVKKNSGPAKVYAPKTGDAIMDSLNATLGEFINQKLTDGTEIVIAVNGVEYNLINFIEDDSKLPDKETWFSFDRILFETNKYNLRPSSGIQLANIAAIMEAYPNVEIKIGGYTDNTGTSEENLKLSQERANSVMSELAKLGVSPARMKAEGYGSQFPVASNDTPEGRAKNRRIDIRVSKK